MDLSPIEQSLLGIRHVRIPRSAENGFGFTLRHFIVYPPDVYEKDESGEEGVVVGKVTEPVDTIFVKSVREDGPAFPAGLCVGDRIVSVNGERIVGKSYDQVVSLIQKSTHYVLLEVSPKQYDTLQLFYEDKAYHSETNLRPTHYSKNSSGTLGEKSQSLELYSHYDSTPIYYTPTPSIKYPASYTLPSSISHDSGLVSHTQYYQPTHSNHPHNNYYSKDYYQVDLPKESFYGHSNNNTYPYYSTYPYKMSTPSNTSSSRPLPPPPTSQQLLSHLPRPTPYKSTPSTWSHLAHRQPQTYYPFSTPQFSDKGEEEEWRRRGEGSKNEEELVKRRLELSKNEEEFKRRVEFRNEDEEDGFKRTDLRVRGNEEERRGGKRGGGLWGIREEKTSPHSSSSTLSRFGSMECVASPLPLTWKNSPGYRFSISTAPGESLVPRSSDSSPATRLLHGPPGGLTNSGNRGGGGGRRDDEMLVTMSGGVNEVGGGWDDKMADRIRRSTEQKEEFLRRPPAAPMQWAGGGGGGLSGPTPFPKEFYAQPQKFQKVPWPPENHLATITSVPPAQCSSVDTMTVSLRSTKGLSTTRGLSLDEKRTGPKLTVSDFSSGGEYGSSGLGRNRVTLIGGGRIHVDPPPGWKHPSLSFDETKTTPSTTANTSSTNDSNVILRKRENDSDNDNDRLVRRVSYLKATSSPIEMERNSSTSPVTPTKSPSGEFRQFGSFPSEKTPDSSEVVREGQVHFKVRAGDAKKGGYYRSWRLGWAQLRSSGVLYLSKERLSKSTIIIGSEPDIVLSIGLKDGVSVESAEDYSKRKHVLRLRTSGSIVQEGGGGGSLSVPVEVLVQAEDGTEVRKWVGRIQQQMDNNNMRDGGGGYFGSSLVPGVRINPHEMSSTSSPRSLLRTFLPPPLHKETPLSSTTTTPLNATALPSTTTPTNLANSSSSTSNGITSTSTNSNNSGSGTTAGHPLSPKNRTWRKRVARQWRKIHSAAGKGNSGQGAALGVALEDCGQSENSGVPRILEYCTELIESKALGTVGIYRIPGNNAAVSALTDILNRGGEPNPTEDPRWTDVHVISSLLKSFLRKLPDPLLTSAKYPDFISAVSSPDAATSSSKLRALVHDLPDSNYEALRHLTLHLRKVAENSGKNLMEPKNLAIVFGPTVVRTSEESVERMVEDMKAQCRIVELLIKNADEIFREKEDSPSPENERMNSPPPPKIEHDIRASLIQAAQRKVLKQSSTSSSASSTNSGLIPKIHHPPHNTYGLPPPPPPLVNENSSKGDRSSVDETGLIRSYAGLGEETEERVRQFERETRAILHRSPNNTISNQTGTNNSETGDKLRTEMRKLEAEWRRAKVDLETEDIYDKLADNPSSIVEHRGTSVTTSHNLSSSSISSTNSNSALSSSNSTPWPVRLGPLPFKNTYNTPTTTPSSDMLPPKVPLHTISTTKKGISPVLTPCKGEKKGSFDGGEMSKKGSFDGGEMSKKGSFDGGSLYEAKVFGSLDSLQNLISSSRENVTTDGSDLVSILSKEMDEKLALVHSSLHSSSPTPPLESKSSEPKTHQNDEKSEKNEKFEKNEKNHADCEESKAEENGKQVTEVKVEKNGLSGRGSEEEEEEKITYRSKNVNGRGRETVNCWEDINEESSEKILKNNLNNVRKFPMSRGSNSCRRKIKSKEVQRRHSLSGTVDILRLVLGRETEANFFINGIKKEDGNNTIVESHV